MHSFKWKMSLQLLNVQLRPSWSSDGCLNKNIGYAALLMRQHAAEHLNFKWDYTGSCDYNKSWGRRLPCMSSNHCSLVMLSDNIIYGSTLVQVMACCLMAPSHYLNQCSLISDEVQWHLRLFSQEVVNQLSLKNTIVMLLPNQEAKQNWLPGMMVGEP